MADARNQGWLCADFPGISAGLVHPSVLNDWLTGHAAGPSALPCGLKASNLLDMLAPTVTCLHWH